MEQPASYFAYWGKTTGEAGTPSRQHHLLPYHSLDVAAVGEILLNADPYLLKMFNPNEILDSNSLTPLICYHLALHDIGKFSERFQSRVPDLYYQLQREKPVGPPSINHGDLGFSAWLDEVWKVVERNDTFYTKSMTSPIDKEVFFPWIKSVMGHHGTPPATFSDADPPKFHFSESNRTAIRDFTINCGNLFIKQPVFSSDLSVDEYDLFFKRTSWLLSGLVTLCDWIASDQRRFIFYSDPMPLQQYWQDIALPSARNAVAKTGILPASASNNRGMAGLFPQYSSNLTPLQSCIERIPLGKGPHLVIIEESTGGGKTEAALILAHRMMQDGLGEGIFMGLPTMATANAMYERLYTAYDRLFSYTVHPTLVLAHGSRNLVPRFQSSIGMEDQPVTQFPVDGEETASAQCTAWLADNRKKSLLASVGIGTLDQALLAVLPKRHQSLRLLGLARHILIVDEVHAYDTYTNELLKNLIHFHAAAGGSTILLSATLPARTRTDFIDSFLAGGGLPAIHGEPAVDYPLITHASPQGIQYYAVGTRVDARKYVQVILVDRYSTVLDAVLKNASEGKCVCWIRNTVADAIDAYQSLYDKMDSSMITLFHARFMMGDRLDKERKILGLFGKESLPENRAGRVVIATQVVEQSLDIDFDFMISDLAPIDLIIQRAGRLHRHKRSDRVGKPVLMVYTPPLTDTPSMSWYSATFPGGSHVYSRSGELWLTAQLLAKKGGFTVPDDARELIEGVYSETADIQKPQSLRAVDHHDDTINRREQAFAQFNSLQFDKGYSRQEESHWGSENQVPTRLGENTIHLRLGYWDGERLKPLYKTVDHPWEMSEVAVRERSISTSVDYPQNQATAIKDAISAMPDRGRWSVLVVMETQDNITYTGYARNHRNERVRLQYSARFGLIATPSQ